MTRLPAAAEAVVDAMDGVSYVVMPDGELVTAARPSWDRFADTAGAAGARTDKMVGRSIFDSISSEAVRRAYRDVHARLVRGEASHVAFEYRCDGPDVRREMRMSISPLRTAGEASYILYQSQVLSAVSRPWMSLFEPQRILEAVRAEAAFPIVRLCGFCQRVDTEAGWVEPETYYRQGGAADVRTSHGVCGACSDKVGLAAEEERVLA